MHRILETQNAWPFGPISLKSCPRQFYCHDTNLGLYMMGQPATGVASTIFGVARSSTCLPYEALAWSTDLLALAPFRQVGH